MAKEITDEVLKQFAILTTLNERMRYMSNENPDHYCDLGDQIQRSYENEMIPVLEPFREDYSAIGRQMDYRERIYKSQISRDAKKAQIGFLEKEGVIDKQNLTDNYFLDHYNDVGFNSVSNVNLTKLIGLANTKRKDREPIWNDIISNNKGAELDSVKKVASLYQG